MESYNAGDGAGFDKSATIKIDDHIDSGRKT